jgi:multiple sugar transport system permease protein
MLPSFAGMIVFSLLPILISIVISLTDWNGLEKLDFSAIAGSFVGFKNYAEILGGGEFWSVLGHTLYFIILYIPLVFLASLLIAEILFKAKKGAGAFRVIYYIPVLTSWVAASLIWKWVLSPQYGVVNQILAAIGIAGPNWLTDELWAMPAIVLASVWKDMGFYGLFLLSGLNGIDNTYYEAARIDGAGKIKLFFSITLPLLSPSLFFCLIMSLINAFQLFPQVMIMTGGGPNGATQVMVERIYTYGFSYFKMGYASAYSWLLFILIFILTLVQLKGQKAWVHYES